MLNSVFRSKVLICDYLVRTKFSSLRILSRLVSSISNKKIDMEGEDRSKPTSDNAKAANPKVYVQRDNSRGMMTISFAYPYKSSSKQFNLYRKNDEFLSVALSRIKLNISKLYNPIKKGKIETAQPEDKTIVELSIDGQVVKSDETQNRDAWIEDAILSIDGKQYAVSTNDPQIMHLKLPSCIMKGFVIMPVVELKNCDFEHCKFVWFRKVSSKERENMLANGEDETKIEMEGLTYWFKVGESISYTPTDEDLAHYLKLSCYPSDGLKSGPELCMTSAKPVELGPYRFPPLERAKQTDKRLLTPNQFRTVTYNILADLYADSEYSRSVLFAHCPTYALNIDYRQQLLLQEITSYNADLICLQEVDKKGFMRVYEPYFRAVANCQGVYHTKGGQVAEGPATFFNSNKFELVDSHRTLLSDLIVPLAVNSCTESDATNKKEKLNTDDKYGEMAELQKNTFDGQLHPIFGDFKSAESKNLLDKFSQLRESVLASDVVKKRFLERHTVIQTCLLRMKECPNTYLLVGNTHLYFAPDADYVRLIQGFCCVGYLEHMKNYFTQKLTNETSNQVNVRLIFCGDMNSTPDCGLYQLLTSGSVSENLKDWTSNEDEQVAGVNLSTSLSFDTAYHNIDYTNYTPGFNGCLDYIYYEKDCLTCESTIPLPDHSDVIAMGGLPSDVFPSDHLALIANMKLSG